MRVIVLVVGGFFEYHAPILLGLLSVCWDCFNKALLESLILAQDERWRRA